MKINQIISEAANPKKQAAIAIAMKEKGQKPKNESHNSEYDDEAGMADNNLETLRRAVDGIDEIIKPGDNLPEWCQEKIAVAKSMLVTVWDYMRSEQDRGANVDESYEESLDEKKETWAKHNNPRAGGMSQKSVRSYRRSHPGSKIQTAVTKKPSKIKKGSKDAKRRASFCARMKGMKKHRTSAKTARDPNSNINKSLRRWHCESIEDMRQLVESAEKKINQLRKQLK